MLTRRGSPSVTEEQTSAAPAVQTPASVAPEPVVAEPVGKTEIIVAHEDSLGALAIRGGKIYYIDYPEFGRDNGSIKVASVDGTLQRGEVRLRGAMSGVVSDDRLALDGDHVYWSNRDDGTIRRTEKLPVE
jgi:hypothetical protein